MDTFERKETKYLLTPMQYIQFRALAEGHLAPAEFHESMVTSVYYDTPDDTLINRSIAGGKYKEKLRVRSYAVDQTPSTPVFVEIKKKFKGITYKRRVCCTQQAADAFLQGMDYEAAIDSWPLADAKAQEAAHSHTSLQIAGEIAWMRDHYERLAPKMTVRTHRLSFVDADDSELRITFDANVRWMRANPNAAEHDLFANGERILEVKCAQAYPLWLVTVLNECGARPQSVSKYGRAYQAALSDVRVAAHVSTTERFIAEHAVNRVTRTAPTARKRSLVASIRGRLANQQAPSLHAFGVSGHTPLHAARH